MIHHSQCPICKSSLIGIFLSAKDHTVSKKTFDIWQCRSCSALFTQDVPSQEKIKAYYASENYISHSDTASGFINKLYHIIRRKTLLSKMNLVKVETGSQQGSILDIGCGTAAFLHTMKQSGWEITGLEPDENARAKARELYNIARLPNQQLFSLPEKNSKPLHFGMC